MSVVNGVFSISCSKCKEQYDFNDDEVEFEITFTEERAQGTEVCYSWEHSFTCETENCENPIEVEYQVYEYPSGAFNSDEIALTGANEITRFSYEFDSIDESESNEEDASDL